jgi:hypothetical protein
MPVLAERKAYVLGFDLAHQCTGSRSFFFIKFVNQTPLSYHSVFITLALFSLNEARSL